MTELEKRAASMKWDPPAPGTEERKEMPKDAFLSPSTRTFPYKVKIDGQWVVSENGLRSAISVANFRGNSIISAKASKLLDELSDGEEAEHSESADDVLAHFGILGMKWGVRNEPGKGGRQALGKTEKATKKAEKKQAKIEQKELNKAENQWIKKTSKSIIQNKMNTAMDDNKDNLEKAYKELVDSGLSGRALNNAYQSATAQIIDQAWSKDPSTYSPSGSVRVGMGEQQVGGNVYLAPNMYVDISNIKHDGLSNFTEIETEEDYGFYQATKEGKLVLKHPEEISHSADDVLSHFGIQGMKWGVRNEPGKGGRQPVEKSAEYKRSRELKSKSTSTLTNAEIKSLNERLQLEKTLSSLTPSTYKKGTSFVKEALSLGTAIASIYALTTTPLGKAVKSAITK